METTVTKRGQTVIPAAIRRQYNIQAGQRVVWIEDGQRIQVIPVSADPIAALEGSGKGVGLVARLLAERQQGRRCASAPHLPRLTASTTIFPQGSRARPDPAAIAHCSG